jgi:hypothetical protein
MNLQPPYQPQPVDGLRVVFPTDVSDLMPARADIPDDFRHNRGDARRWIRFQEVWFFHGLQAVKLVAKPGIDRNQAMRHLATIQNSFDPSHGDKEAAVAFLASLWLEPVDLGVHDDERR